MGRRGWTDILKGRAFQSSETENDVLSGSPPLERHGPHSQDSIASLRTGLFVRSGWPLFVQIEASDRAVCDHRSGRESQGGPT